MGNPFEWLRSMARRSADDDELVREAAHALGALGGDPAGLVVAARRLLAHHRRHGGLWWAASHVLCAPDPGAAARACDDLVTSDRTVARLAGALGLQGGDEHLGVVGWSDAIEAVLEERPDLDVVAVVDDDDRTIARRAASRADVVDAWGLADASVATVLVAVDAVGPRAALCDGAIRDVRAEVPRADLWLVAPLPRLLNGSLFDAMAASLHDDERVTTLALAHVDRIAGPGGVEPPGDALTHTACPVAAELLRPLD